jgi:predicted O-linked N-acetylglucosamine transferase (SPINDLY family)
VTYLGYPVTTGMSAMDYKLTDAWQDPPQNDPYYTEKLVRLAGGAWCFRPREQMPAVSVLPADTNGYITFLSPNKVAKVTAPMLELWREILRRIPDARLVILTGGDSSGEQRVRSIMSDVEPSRVELVARLPTERYFGLYQRADLTLDAFPYNGYMTTCDSLWMGVPVITLAGRTHVSRTGVSLLSKIGLDQLIAAAPEQYVERAIASAQDRDGLRTLRAGMRDRIRDSGLTDGARLAHEIETAYRDMWRRWCAETH